MLKRNKKFMITVAAAIGAFIGLIYNSVLPEEVSAASSRVWGQDRYETAVEVSKQGWQSSDYVILASGEGYADALCAAPLAKKYNAPILLTGSSTLNEKAKEEIKRLNAKHVFIIGKYASVSENAEKELGTLVSDIKRLGGNDRYETSIVVAKELGTVDSVTITSGFGFADALSIAPIAAQKNMPILLTGKDQLPEIVQSYIKDNSSSIKNTYIVGGTTVISDKVAQSVSQNSVRLSGSDRFETNLKVMEYFKNELKFDNLYVVQADGPTGNEFADALAGSALAVKTNSPVVLTYNNISDNVQSFIKANAKNTASIIALGGVAAVPDTLVSKLSQVISSIGTTTPTTPTTPAQGGSSSGGGGSSSGDNETEEKLKDLVNQLKTAEAGLSNEKEKEIVTKIIESINKVLADSNYDIEDDAAEVKALYKALSTSEQDELYSKIRSSGVSLSDVLELKEKFGL